MQFNVRVCMCSLLVRSVQTHTNNMTVLPSHSSSSPSPLNPLSLRVFSSSPSLATHPQLGTILSHLIPSPSQERRVCVCCATTVNSTPLRCGPCVPPSPYSSLSSASRGVAVVETQHKKTHAPRFPCCITAPSSLFLSVVNPITHTHTHTHTYTHTHTNMHAHPHTHMHPPDWSR